MNIKTECSCSEHHVLTPDKEITLGQEYDECPLCEEMTIVVEVSL